MKTDVKDRKILAIMGILGGLCFAIGDILINLVPHYNSNEIYYDWAQMNMWRISLSIYLGCLGGVLLLMGFYCLYKTIADNLSKIEKGWLIFIGSGIAMTPVGHFVIACICPMTYKAALNLGLSDELSRALAGTWADNLAPLRIVVMIIVILLQSITIIFLILRNKLKCPKWMIVFNPMMFIIIGIPVMILLSGTGVEGVTESFESLGEGAVYLIVLSHLKRNK